MANKSTREERIRLERQKQFDKESKKLIFAPIAGIVCYVAVMLLFFAHWADIYNTGIPGVEVKITGFNTLFSAFTGFENLAASFLENFENAPASYGDMLVPFYYYAGGYCKALGGLTIAAFFAAILALISSVLMLFFKKNVFNLVSAGLYAAVFVLLLICFIVALSMSGSKILPVYCGGNPKCSIRSYAVIPAIISLLGAAAQGYGCLRYNILKNKMK